MFTVNKVNRQKMNELKDIIGINEIADIANVSSSAVINWRKRDKNFPEPITELKSGPVFHYDQIRKYLKRRKVHMATVISTINLKGGVAKTTITVALGEFLAAEFKKKVLIIDLDPQTNATVMLIGDKNWQKLNDQNYTLARLFEDALDPDNANFNLEKTLQKNVSDVASVTKLDLLPSSLNLIDIQDRIAAVPPGKFYSIVPTDILRRAIKDKMDEYDLILIDCPPNLGIITLNGLKISDGYIIPTIPDILSTYGIPQVISRIKDFSFNIGENIENYGIIATKYDARNTIHNNIIKQLEREKEGPFFKTMIKQNTQSSAAAEHSQHNTLRQKWGYNPGQYEAYYALTKELLEKVGL